MWDPNGQSLSLIEFYTFFNSHSANNLSVYACAINLYLHTIQMVIKLQFYDNCYFVSNKENKCITRENNKIQRIFFFEFTIFLRIKWLNSNDEQNNVQYIIAPFMYEESWSEGERELAICIN